MALPLLALPTGAAALAGGVKTMAAGAAAKGAAAGGATSLLSSISKFIPFLGSAGDAFMQHRGQQMANRHNERMAQQQRDWQRQMWDLQNAYNHPSEQMARLKEAGLNPRMIYNTGASSAVGTAGDVKGYTRAEAKSTTAGLNAFSNIVQLKAVQAQTNNVEAQTKLTQQKALREAVETAIQGKRNRFENAMLQSNLEGLQLSNQETRGKTAVLREQYQLLRGTRKSKVDSAITEAKILAQKFRGEKLQNALRKWEVGLSKKGLTKNDSEIVRMMVSEDPQIVFKLGEMGLKTLTKALKF